MNSHTVTHLLLVDDVPARRDRLCINLEQQGYRLSTTDSIEQALAALETQPIDLLLLAVQPLQINAFEFLQHLKLNSNYSTIPVIMLNGQQDDNLLEQCLALGADDYVSEPCSPKLMSHRIDRCLSAKSSSSQAALPSIEQHLKTKNSASSCSSEVLNVEKLANDLTRIILPLGIELSAEREFDRLSERILTEAKRICNADAGTLYLRAEENSLKFVLMSTDSLQLSLGGTTGNPISLPPLRLYTSEGEPNHHNIAAHVTLTGETIHIPDIYQAEGFDFSGTKAYDQKNGYRSVSCLTVPLKNHENVVIGVLQLLNAQDAATGDIIPFSDYLQEVVEWLSGQAAAALNNQLLLQQQTQLLKGERDLQIGRMIQADFLPETLPQPPGWEIAARFYPAREVAGDFYDAFTMTHGRIGIVIADVCDKGVGAALFMSLFRSLIRVLARQNYSLGLLDMLTDDTSKGGSRSHRGKRRLPSIGTQALKNAVELTNDYIGDNHSRTNMFATLFFGVLDPATGAMSYINGGHEAPVICGANGIKARLKSTGPAVGMIPGIEFRIDEAQFEPGDILFSYTDGVPEAHNLDGNLFTDQALFKLLEKPAASASELLDRIETNVRAHAVGAPQFDDITMLAVRWSPSD